MLNTIKFPMTANKEVEIVDSCMGTSKTTYMLRWIDSQPKQEVYFCISTTNRSRGRWKNT